MNDTDIKNLAHKFDAYESGGMTEEEEIEFFQELVSSGLAWSLQGHYGRVAMHLIESGHVQPPPQNGQVGEA